MTKWLHRYLQGDHIKVWSEITDLGPAIRSDVEAMVEADRVGRETMRRARSNVEQLIEELPRIGYCFTQDEHFYPFRPPEADITARLDEIEARVGALPLAWRWWSEEVGRVNLVGGHPEWECGYLDPLVVDAPPDHIDAERDVWEQNQGTDWDTGEPFSIDFSPDHLHKAAISGGAPYALLLPNGAADGTVHQEPHHGTFVSYLRIAFANGGFLGWSAGHCEGPMPDDLVRLAKKLQPL